MSRYIRFNLTQAQIGTTISVKSHKVWNTPNGSHIYHVELNNGLDIVVCSDAKKSGIRKQYCQRFSIFDKVFTAEYDTTMALMFAVFAAGHDHYIFYITRLSADGEENFGSLKLRRGCKPTFMDEEVGETKCRGMLNKLRLLTPRGGT